ncbi:hypothetical protein PsorP6_012645 [Peronosclerospora sorghi]|uniref:Uncharacterized protein n=1 Tax=Peronosclerospora sorghi TaxID=230839 RepID=A0ACC0WEJ1_9STRA|nr:hypothetical protein PsorP6_012645 [Peronosclerospora sorghi]
MNTILDLFVAVRSAAREDESLSQGLTMLLDFPKAYDSLSWVFLFAALRYLGFPDNFVRLVRILHDNTRCRFLWFGVTCDIRQGCQLAPLLFILALELRYEEIENTTELDGVILSSLSKQINVKICGFGTASGLRVNARNSMLIPLRSGAIIDPASLCDMKLLRDSEHCRYLGIQVIVDDSTKANLEACSSSINARLHLKRDALDVAVIVPKIVFVARHVWPPTATTDQLQQLVKRFVWGKRDGKKVRDWMGEMKAEVPILEGGIAVPNIQAELLTMAAMTVGRWASGSTGAGAQGADVYLTPMFDTTAKDANYYSSTIWASGAAFVLSVYGGTLSAAEHRLVRDDREAMQTSLSNARWQDAEVVYSIDATKMTMVSDHRGAFCDEWIRHKILHAATWIHNGQGSPFKIGDFARATDRRRTLGDVIEWSWSRRGEITFQVREYPDPRPSTRR